MRLHHEDIIASNRLTEVCFGNQARTGGGRRQCSRLIIKVSNLHVSMSEFPPESEPTTSSGIPGKHEASENVVEDYSESNTVVSSKEQETSLYKHLWKKIKRVRRGNDTYPLPTNR